MGMGAGVPYSGRRERRGPGGAQEEGQAAGQRSQTEQRGRAAVAAGLESGDESQCLYPDVCLRHRP